MSPVFTRAAQALAEFLKKTGQPEGPSTCKIHEALQEGAETWRVHEYGNIRLFNDSRTFAAFNADQSQIPELFCFLRSQLEINEHIKQSSRPRPKFFGKSLLSLYSPFSRRNYFHWLFDVLPRLHLFRTAFPGVSPDYYLFPGSLEVSYRRQTLDLLGIPASQRLSNSGNPHWVCRKLYVTDHPQLQTGKGQTPIRQWVCQFLRDTYLPFVEIKESLPKRIYISREDSNTGRQVVNNQEVQELLGRYDIQPVVLGQLSFSDQLALFAGAEVVTGVHGAGLSNTVFCRPGTSLLEIFNDNYHTVSYVSIAGKCGLRYIPAEQKSIDTTGRPLAGNVRVDLPGLQKKLEAALTH